MITNNVTRLLTSRKIQFAAFELPAEKLGALETARLLNIPPELVFKTIVILREKPGKPILAVIPGNAQVDLKLIAAAVNEKKVHVATQKEAENLTGLQVGGISPLALLQRGFQILLDSSAQTLDEFHISGGQRGLNIRLRVKDFLSLTNTRVAVVSHPLTDSDDFSD